MSKQIKAGKFTSKVRLNVGNWKPAISEDVRVRGIIKWLEEACDRLDASEASRKELLEACKAAGIELGQRYKAQEESPADK